MSLIAKRVWGLVEGILLATSILVGYGAGTLNAAEIASSTGQVFNVKAYGAKGDGLTDDAPAIRAALAAASHGSTVFLPYGRYLLTEGVRLSIPATIQCAPGTVLTYAPARGAAITAAYGGMGGAVRGCQFLGPGASTSTAAIQIGSGRQGVVDFLISNVRIGQHGTTATGFGTAISVGPGIVPNNINDQIFNCLIQGNGIGVDVVEAEQLIITGGNISENSIGVKTALYAMDVTITGTSMDSNTEYYIDNEGLTVVNLNGVHFESNQVPYTDFIYSGGRYVNAVNMNGGMLLDDRTLGTQADMVKANCKYCQFNAYGVWVQTKGIKVRQAVNFAANGAGGVLQLYNNGPSNFTADYAITAPSSAYSKVLYFQLQNAGAPQTATWENESLHLRGAASYYDSGGRYFFGGTSSNASIGQVARAPKGACATGSIDVNTAGGRGTTLYVCEAGTWIAK